MRRIAARPLDARCSRPRPKLAERGAPLRAFMGHNDPVAWWWGPAKRDWYRGDYQKAYEELGEPPDFREKMARALRQAGRMVSLGDTEANRQLRITGEGSNF
jgi:hypothetical protein